MTPQEQLDKQYIHEVSTVTIDYLEYVKSQIYLYPKDRHKINKSLLNIRSIRKRNNYLNNLQQKLKI